MTHVRRASYFVVAGVLLAAAPPAFAETNALIGGGPDIGLWDVADGHHMLGFHTRAMLHLGADHKRSARFDVSFSNFWAEGEQNEDYGELAVFANMVVALKQEPGPYWTIGLGYDWTTEDVLPDESTGGLVLGTGFGTRLGWGNIEARFELAHTGAGTGAHVPIFVALRF